MRLIGLVVALTLSVILATHAAQAQQKLSELGYVEGRTIVFEYSTSDGQPERLPALAQNLIQRRADVIVTYGTPPTQAAKQATTIPIVMVGIGDPVHAGLVPSLARPGGNITGNTILECLECLHHEPFAEPPLLRGAQVRIARDAGDGFAPGASPPRTFLCGSRSGRCRPGNFGHFGRVLSLRIVCAECWAASGISYRFYE